MTGSARTVLEALAAGVESGAVVCAVLQHGPVTGWLVVEEAADAGTEKRCAVVRLDGCAVVAAGVVSEVQVSGEAVLTDEAMPAWAPALAGAFWASRQYRAEAEEARAALRNQQARLERIVDAAHDYANDNSLCELFDSFMIEQGLRPRSRNYVCEVDATVRVRVSVTAHSAEAAEGLVTDRMVVDAVRQLEQWQLGDAVQEHEVIDVEED